MQICGLYSQTQLLVKSCAGACFHALGYHAQAVRDYNDALGFEHAGTVEDVNPETLSLQYLSFYQRETALYLRSRIDAPIDTFCLDADLRPDFKVRCGCIIR